MKMKSVLLVNDSSQECELIRELFSEMYPGAAMRIAHNGRSALDSLMGVPETAEELQLNPDVIIISDSVSDFSPTEICSVVSNYYRFRHIKFYLLADPAKIQFETGDRPLFNGYLNRPFGNDTDTREKFAQLKPDFDGSNRQLAMLPFLALMKGKLMPLYGSLSGGVKAAACIACIGTAAVVVPVLDNERDIADQQPVAVPTVGAVSNDHLRPVEILPPTAEPAAVEIEPLIDVSVQQEEIILHTEPVPAEPQPAKDTVMQKKTFSIGVKSIDRSKP